MTKNYDQTWESGADQPTRIKHNRAATTDPTASDDVDSGYEVGSTWWNTSANRTWRCLSAASGAAVWMVDMSAKSGGSNGTGVYGAQVLHPGDYGRTFHHDGTRWQTEEQVVHWGGSQAITVATRWYIPITTDYEGVFIWRVPIYGKVNGTNDGSNYWVHKLVSIEYDGTEADVVDSETDTSSQTVDTFDYWDAYPEVVLDSSTYIAMAMDLATVGSPGAYSPFMGLVGYSLVGY